MIKFDTEEAFYNGIDHLTQRGLSYKANHNTLTIIIEGY
tara:strand:+ start:965 stop:1081 length:117 start_codon:yes stop_codon:yes gene_type:complete